MYKADMNFSFKKLAGTAIFALALIFAFSVPASKVFADPSSLPAQLYVRNGGGRISWIEHHADEPVGVYSRCGGGPNGTCDTVVTVHQASDGTISVTPNADKSGNIGSSPEYYFSDQGYLKGSLNASNFGTTPNSIKFDPAASYKPPSTPSTTPPPSTTPSGDVIDTGLDSTVLAGAGHPVTINENVNGTQIKATGTEYPPDASGNSKSTSLM